MTPSVSNSKKIRFLGSIRSQLIFGFGLMLFLAIVIAVIGYRSLNSYQTSVETTLEDANRARELTLEIENEFLQARQEEANFLASWRSIGFEEAYADFVVLNEQRLERARSKIAEVDYLVRDAADPGLQAILDDTARLLPFLDQYETAFQAVVSDIEQRSRVDGQESVMFSTLNEMEADFLTLENPEFYLITLQIRANEQQYLYTGQQQYFDSLRLLILDFTHLVQDSSSSDLMSDAGRLSASKLLDQIDLYSSSLNELVSIENDIAVNSIVFRETTTDINEVTNQILQKGEAGFTNSRAQLQEVSQQARVALFAVSGLSLAIGVLSSYALARRIIVPLSELSQAVQLMGEGELSQRIQVFGSEEIVTLSASFNKMAEQLRGTLLGLEQRVADRTRALETSTEVGRRLSTILDQTQLVKEVVEQVRDAFDYYHAQIYLFDEAKENLVLVGGTGEAGQAMLEDGHQIPTGQGLVGRAVDTNQVILVTDVSQEQGWMSNPLLPETRAEVAVPISLGDEVLGVLDVQDNEVGGLSQADADLLQSISNQVAVTLQNVFTIQEVRRSARRETQLGDISARIQGTTNVEDAIKVAVRELSLALDKDTFAQLMPEKE
jgi:putative methionine-R-sulfoxide reductase with GAF domain